jgi:heme A synthase
MKNVWRFRLAVLTAIGALALIVDGALVGPGSQLASAALPSHRNAATVESLLTLALVLWLAFTDRRTPPRILGWLTLAIVLVQDSVGHTAVLASAPRTAAILHACLAPLFFSALVAIAVVTSEAWSRGPEFVSDYGWPSNRTLAVLSPVLVLLQIALGAAFRQKAASLMPHVLGAMLVALVILMQGVFVLQQFQSHRALQLAGKTLLGVAFTQVFLGITTLTLKSMADETEPAVLVTVASHVTGGAVTLAVTLVLSIFVRRNVQPRVEEEDSGQPAVTG